ncbi:hypothetical protein QQZ08_005073 [Neonectria magnoliae]|uniref:Uncharacterized protein n=1 Tax=Neonectria magnoliae TaxID=2732573 RepID=A0ABR1I4I9_9HYPO
MAYSATLAQLRRLLSSERHKRLLNLFSRAGLSMNQSQLDGPLLERATAAILETRDGNLRVAVPINPVDDCVLLNDVDHKEMCTALEEHKKIMKTYPRRGEGIEAYVDASDTGYTVTVFLAANGLPMNGVENSYHHVSGPEDVDGLQSGGEGMNNNYVLNGRANGYKDGVGKLSSGLKGKVNGLEKTIFSTVAVDSLRGS